MRGLNKVMLLGFLGKDPEYKQFDSGSEVTTFSLAVDESYRSNGQDVKKTSWHNVAVWGKIAVHCANYLKKGSLIYLEGKIAYEEYEKDGEKKYITKVYAHDIRFLDRKPVDAVSQPDKATPPPDLGMGEFINNDDIPF